MPDCLTVSRGQSRLASPMTRAMAPSWQQTRGVCRLAKLSGADFSNSAAIRLPGRFGSLLAGAQGPSNQLIEKDLSGVSRVHLQIFPVMQGKRVRARLA
jgi:hypothetical protein